ncbi:MAG: trypsin-like serine protease [Kofleriaceae bacterium]|nr:trypsin-like serine protease [Kofleriaceae bacterium]
MRRTPLTAALMFLALVGCQYDSDFSEEDLGSVELASIGGSSANGEAHYDAVAAITISRPKRNSMSREDVRCTGVLVEERTVLTSASCLSRNVEAEIDPQRPDTEQYLDAASVYVQFGSSVSGTMEYALDSTFDQGPNTHKGVTLHRYYEFDGGGLNDIALLRLAESPGITPATVHKEDLDKATLESMSTPLELVGYGKDDDNGDTAVFTVRTVVAPVITKVNFSDIAAGDALVNTCHADRGGPGFLDFNGSVEVVSVTGSVNDNDQCDKIVNRQRVDRYAAQFLIPYIARFEEPCMGADCDDCDYDGFCEEACPTRDFDCELGAFAGDACESNGECEQGGHCIEATDDPTNTYCAIPCDTDDVSGCPASMVCSPTDPDGDDPTTGECIYDGISPGSQGAGCTTPGDCRSGFCESLFCANPCDIADANACDAAGGFLCLPASTDGAVNVCRLDVDTNGGGFCGVSAASWAGASGSGTRTTFLSCLGLLFLVGLFRRRRQA